ncbi:MAG TPA: hypothetical protein VMU29_12165 [Smithella sp.]|nr:hypothetical protein [Smithella sp.]
MDPLSQLIKHSTGQKIPDFLKEITGDDYRAFMYRLKKRVLKYDDVRRIVKALGISFDQFDTMYYTEEPKKERKPKNPTSKPKPIPSDSPKKPKTKEIIQEPLEPEIFGHGLAQKPLSEIFRDEQQTDF